MRMQENPTLHRRTKLIRAGAVITHRSQREVPQPRFNGFLCGVTQPLTPAANYYHWALFSVSTKSKGRMRWWLEWWHTHIIFRRSVSFDGRWLGKGDGANFWFVQWKRKAICLFQWIQLVKKIKQNTDEGALKPNKQTTNQQLLPCYIHLLFVSTEQIIPNTIRPDCIWNRVKKWMTAAAAVNYFLK